MHQLPEIMNEANEQYVILGKALSYASEFEENCRKLAHLFDCDKAENDFGYEVWKLMKDGTLYNKIHLISKRFELAPWAIEKVHSAREARNLLVHELPKEHRRLLVSESGRRHFQSNIVVNVQQILEGNLIVLDATEILLSGIEHRHGSDIMQYHSAVINWLLDLRK